MKYQLISKTTKEVISTITTSNINSISAAKEYFLKVKQLSEESFNKLFEVEKAKLTRREYKWWEEDKKITDEELNGKDGR